MKRARKMNGPAGKERESYSHQNEIAALAMTREMKDQVRQSHGEAA